MRRATAWRRPRPDRRGAEAKPAGLLERLGADPDTMPPSAQIEEEIARLRRARDALGAVNLRAEEDAKAVQEEHDTLAHEKADLEEAIKRKLRAGIAALNREGRERLLTAFEQVNANFGHALHPSLRRRRGAAGAGRIRRPAGGGAGDHVPAAGQEAVDAVACCRGASRR
jgi:hypothetical protein